MRILQVTKWLSPRADSGGKLRTYGLGLALSRFAEVEIVGFGDGGEHEALGDSPRLRHYRRFHPIEMEGGWRRAAGVAADLSRGQALRSSRFGSDTYRRRVVEILREGAYDAVQVEELSTMSNLPPTATTQPLVYSAHNVESTLSPQLIRARQSVLRGLAAMEGRRTQVEEQRALARADLCLATSEGDKDALTRLDPSARSRVHVIPNCTFDDTAPGAPQGSTGAEIVTIGCFAWYPNAQGARWFVADVLPILRKERPCAVRFVGSQIDRALANVLVGAGCEISADVDDTMPFLHRARATFVPLFSGGGTRLKIVEAWAGGVPVVSTPLGAEGLGCTDGVDVLLAVDAKSFAAALWRVIEDDDLYHRLRENGLRRAASMRWTQQAAFLQELYDTLLRQGRL